ncbi:MAG: inositol monophosphatase [Bacteroidaceae bacterium]|nr:inositol monophosphatase [Bacteroidaceae bacterium]
MRNFVLLNILIIQVLVLDLEQLTQEVCRVAREAGAYLRDEQQRLKAEQVERKHAHDYVSYVDKTSEEMIVARLRLLLPEAGFLTEEGTCLTEEAVEDEGRGVPCWVIDPLDGTTNYVHGNHPFAVSIALRNEREVLMGVVYEVSLDECFAAWKGGGAWLNGKPIGVSNKPIKEALLGLELPYDADMYRETGLRLIRHFYGYAGGIRMNGSAAVALCYVACGRWDGWIERGLGQWDFMAAGLIIKEAGGKTTNFEGNPFFLNGDDIVASNGLIQEDLLQALNDLTI